MSAETDALIRYVASTGIEFRVTDVNSPGVHSARSWHYAQGTDGVGLAVDFAGPVSYWVDPAASTPVLKAIYAALKPLKDAGLLVELLGPGDPGHSDHIHAAVRRGTFLVPLKKENGMTVQVIAAFPYEDGYVLVLNTGQVYAFSCQYKGGLEILPDGTVKVNYPQSG